MKIIISLSIFTKKKRESDLNIKYFVSIDLREREMLTNLNTDLAMSVIAILINVLMILLFSARAMKGQKEEYIIGMILILLAIPIFAISLLNFISGREWWTYILPLPMVVFLIIELFFDYINEFNFRKNKLLIPYLIFYYAGLLGMIGYAFLTSKGMGYTVLILYFLHQLVSLYAHKKKN